MDRIRIISDVEKPTPPPPLQLVISNLLKYPRSLVVVVTMGSEVVFCRTNSLLLFAPHFYVQFEVEVAAREIKIQSVSWENARVVLPLYIFKKSLVAWGLL